tara:strand:+ start:59774 stop:60247 length:474 start_codon:yes stop_codon:yes gene_type:complete
MVTFQEAYVPLQKQFKLPSYNELNEEFELLYISQIAAIDFPLRFVRRRILDKINVSCNFFQAILQPNPNSLISMREASFYSKDNKEVMFDLLKECMQLSRSSLLLETKSSNNDEAEYIKSALKLWNKIRPEYTKFARKLSDGWMKKEVKKEKESYFN